jgi:hypothetical protein
MATLPESIYMFNVIPIKIPMISITGIEKSALKFICKHKILQIDKAMLSKKGNAGDTTYSTSNYCRDIAIKTV